MSCRLGSSASNTGATTINPEMVRLQQRVQSACMHFTSRLRSHFAESALVLSRSLEQEKTAIMTKARQELKAEVDDLKAQLVAAKTTQNGGDWQEPCHANVLSVLRPSIVHAAPMYTRTALQALRDQMLLCSRGCSPASSLSR
eukprot:6468972-Amphidinium_carterae.2